MTSEGKLLSGFAAIVLASGVLGGGALYVVQLRHALAAARTVAATQRMVAAVAHEQAATNADAAIIADRGAQRDALTITLQQDHAHDLQTASGADAPIDPALNAAGRRGLCEYAAYAADPGCAGLRSGHP